MVRYIEGEPNASGLKIGIVVSRFNDFITSHLLSGALEALGQHGADEKDIEVVRVPGAFEIPMAAKKALRRQNVRCRRMSRGGHSRCNTSFLIMWQGRLRGEWRRLLGRLEFPSFLGCLPQIMWSKPSNGPVVSQGTKAWTRL